MSRRPKETPPHFVSASDLSFEAAGHYRGATWARDMLEGTLEIRTKDDSEAFDLGLVWTRSRSTNKVRAALEEAYVWAVAAGVPRPDARDFYASKAHTVARDRLTKAIEAAVYGGQPRKEMDAVFGEFVEAVATHAPHMATSLADGFRRASHVAYRPPSLLGFSHTRRIQLLSRTIVDDVQPVMGSASGDPRLARRIAGFGDKLAKAADAARSHSARALATT